MKDDEPPSSLSPSRVSSPLPLPEQKVSAAYRARLRCKNARINNGHKFRRSGERRKKKKNKSKHYTPPPPSSPQPPSPPPSSLQQPAVPYDYDEMFPTLEPKGSVWMRQSMIYAESPLEHYNADSGNEVKYELVRAIISGTIFTSRAGYGHVNFIARASGSSQEQLFFAELVHKDSKGWMPTCLRSLHDEADRVGGLAADPPVELPSRRNYWFFCSDEIKHPEDGASYHAVHCL